MMPPKKQAPAKRGRPAGFTMSKAQKEAMAKGRVSARAVKEYLNYVVSGELPKGTARKPGKRVEQWREQAASATDPLKRLEAQAKVMRAEMGLSEAAPARSAEQLEEAFIEHAADYARSKEIPREAFEALGVKSSVLDRARL